MYKFKVKNFSLTLQNIINKISHYFFINPIESILELNLCLEFMFESKVQFIIILHFIYSRVGDLPLCALKKVNTEFCKKGSTYTLEGESAFWRLNCKKVNFPFQAPNFVSISVLRK